MQSEHYNSSAIFLCVTWWYLEVGLWSTRWHTVALEQATEDIWMRETQVKYLDKH